MTCCHGATSTPAFMPVVRRRPGVRIPSGEPGPTHSFFKTAADSPPAALKRPRLRPRLGLPTSLRRKHNSRDIEGWGAGRVATEKESLLHLKLLLSFLGGGGWERCRLGRPSLGVSAPLLGFTERKRRGQCGGHQPTTDRTVCSCSCCGEHLRIDKSGG